MRGPGGFDPTGPRIFWALFQEELAAVFRPKYNRHLWYGYIQGYGKRGAAEDLAAFHHHAHEAEVACPDNRALAHALRVVSGLVNIQSEV